MEKPLTVFQARRLLVQIRFRILGSVIHNPFLHFNKSIRPKDIAFLNLNASTGAQSLEGRNTNTSVAHMNCTYYIESQRYKFNLAAQSTLKESVARVRYQGMDILKMLCH
jgi:hypothetical protein